MASYAKPLPAPDPVTAPYWASLKVHALQLQRCADCSGFIFYPRAICPSCMGDDLRWTLVSGRGVIHAFTIPHRHPNPSFGSETPYVVALVELDEGVRMLTNIVGVEPSPEAVQIGQAVEIVYDDVTEEITLPRFRPCQ